MSKHETPERQPYRPPEAELLYDDRCRACNLLAGAVRALDSTGKVKLTGFAALGRQATDLTREGLGRSLHVIRQGVLLSGGDGVLAIVSTLFPPFAIVERFQTPRRVLRRVYRLVADVIHD